MSTKILTSRCLATLPILALLIGIAPVPRVSAAPPAADPLLIPPSFPSPVPPAASWKSLDADQLDSTITSAVDTYHIPGAAVCVVKDGAVVWSHSYGYADVELEVPVTDSTVFMLASVSKTFVGIALMQLVEDGLLDLDADVNEYLLFSVSSPYHPLAPITPRMLLCHTSSIRYNAAVWLPLITWGGDSPIELGDFLADYLVKGGSRYRVDNYRSYAPGTGGEYSNIAYALAGYLVEAITGQTLEEYCRRNIFDPLNLEETSWMLAGLDADHVAVPTDYRGGAFVPYGHFGFPMYPAGQLRTSLAQLARYLLMFMNQGEIDGVRILGISTVKHMMTVQYPEAPVFDGYEWGLGWYRIDTGVDWLWGHTGGIYGVSTMMYFEPLDDYGFIYLTNGNGTDGHSIIASALYAYARNLGGPTPALLTSFGAERRADGSAYLRWTTPATSSLQGFHVWREQPEQARTRLTMRVVRGNPHAEYEFVDAAAPSGMSIYWLQSLDEDGSTSWAGSTALARAPTVAVSPAVLTSWPNPFRAVTNLSFDVRDPSRVVVGVYDVQGRRVRTLLDGWRPAGTHARVWNGEDDSGRPVAAGTYVYRVQIGQRVSISKVTRRR
jgi:CubicO group peptidase (beta-lactamase class C family)